MEEFFSNKTDSSYRSIGQTGESANEGGGYSFVFHDRLQEKEEEEKKKKEVIIKDPVILNLSSQTKRNLEEKKNDDGDKNTSSDNKIKRINIMA